MRKRKRKAPKRYIAIDYDNKNGFPLSTAERQSQRFQMDEELNSYEVCFRKVTTKYNNIVCDCYGFVLYLFCRAQCTVPVHREN